MKAEEKMLRDDQLDNIAGGAMKSGYEDELTEMIAYLKGIGFSEVRILEFVKENWNSNTMVDWLKNSTTNFSSNDYKLVTEFVCDNYSSIKAKK